MSRGTGRMQRRGLLILWNHPEGTSAGMPLAELNRRISTDRSNARRAIRTLTERGLVEEVRDEEGTRRIKLTGGAHLALVLSGAVDRTLTLEDMPSRPLDLDLVYDGVDPHEAAEPSWSFDDTSESRLSDNLDNTMSLGIPHVPLPPLSDLPVSDPAGYSMPMRTPHANGPGHSESPLSDNGAGDHDRDYPMSLGLPHGPSPPSPDRGVSDPPSYVPGLALKIAARMARERLERLDDGEGA